MPRIRTLFILAIVSLFAVAACSDDDDTSKQDDLNLEEPDAGADDTGSADDEDATTFTDTGGDEDTGTVEDTGPEEDTGTEDAGIDEDAGEDDDPWPEGSADDHADPPSEPVCMESLDETNACAGFAKGQWENAEVCTDFTVEDALQEFGCFGADVRTFDYWVAEGSGTLELTDDSFTRDLQIVVDADMYIPESCLDFMGMELTCDDFAAGAADFLNITMQCDTIDDEEDGGPGCDCLVDEETIDRSSSGVLTVDDNILRLEGEGTYYYCAEDGVLNLRTTSEQDIPMTESYTFAP